METLNQIILSGAVLVALSILAGNLSSRLGVPVLLVFLGLGMLCGQDGPVGIVFDDYRTTYLVGSVALALILFNGGLHTPRVVFRIALWPAVTLSTVGVLVTAGLVGGVAMLLLEIGPVQAFLLGAILASTDAAAVFSLLHATGMEVSKRVSATLEAESGINDPMAVFLTIAGVELLTGPGTGSAWHLLATFCMQLAGGTALGLAGGVTIAWIVNRIEIAAGLYPILVAALAVSLFSAANLVEASGFLAVYLAGLVLGGRPLQARQVIGRFMDGLAWLSQIVMFLLLGLLVTPSKLVADLWAALAIAGVLMFVARPLAVWLCLAPFRFDWREKSFIAWVGLRGAVPIFLASIPVLAGVPAGEAYFNAAFVAVFASLVLQGWTVGFAARALGLELPPESEPVSRYELDLPAATDREIAGYRVGAGSLAAGTPFADLPLPKRTRIVGVIRGGTVMRRDALDRLEPQDYVINVVPPQQVLALDRLYAPRTGRDRPDVAGLGEFTLAPDAPVAAVAHEYDLPIAPEEGRETIAHLLRARIGRQVVVGDRLRLGPAELVVRGVDGERITAIGLELEPESEWLPIARFWAGLTRRLGRRRPEAD